MTDIPMAAASTWLANVNAKDVALLPTLTAQQVWMHVGWAVVLVWIAAALLRRSGMQSWLTWVAAGVLGAWTCVPGVYSPHYWLGLAFQAPSLTTLVLCGVAVYRMASGPVRQEYRQTGNSPLMVLGVGIGWFLLLDTLALLPGVQLYALGFSPIAPAMLLVLACLPWVWTGVGWLVWVFAAVVAGIFMVWHLPTGNVWDAVLDPWLWAALHVWLWRAWSYKRTSFST